MSCPICNGPIPNAMDEGKYSGALSRRDNKTEICSDCGVREAIEDYLTRKKGGVMKRKIFKGTFSVNLTVTAYDEEEAIDKLYERLDEAIHNQEMWSEDYVLHEQDVEEVSPHD